MMKMKIIVVSKQKTGSWKELAQEYLKRLQPYAKVEVVEIAEEKFNNASDRARVSKVEAERIHKAIPEDAIKIICDEHGREFTSTEFSDKLIDLSENGQREIVFIIGGPLGLDQALINNANQTLALSKMTLPHDEARVFLLEQLYRAMTIQHNKTYHY
jgi:23S rRNA (pseudouridine1915-N3)-methyltransferase